MVRAFSPYALPRKSLGLRFAPAQAVMEPRRWRSGKHRFVLVGFLLPFQLWNRAVGAQENTAFASKASGLFG